MILIFQHLLLVYYVCTSLSFPLLFTSPSLSLLFSPFFLLSPSWLHWYSTGSSIPSLPLPFHLFPLDTATFYFFSLSVRTFPRVDLSVFYCNSDLLTIFSRHKCWHIYCSPNKIHINLCIFLILMSVFFFLVSLLWHLFRN